MKRIYFLLFICTFVFLTGCSSSTNEIKPTFNAPPYVDTSRPSNEVQVNFTVYDRQTNIPLPCMIVKVIFTSGVNAGYPYYWSTNNDGVAKIFLDTRNPAYWYVANNSNVYFEQSGVYDYALGLRDISVYLVRR